MQSSLHESIEIVSLTLDFLRPASARPLSDPRLSLSFISFASLGLGKSKNNGGGEKFASAAKSSLVDMPPSLPEPHRRDVIGDEIIYFQATRLMIHN